MPDKVGALCHAGVQDGQHAWIIRLQSHLVRDFGDIDKLAWGSRFRRRLLLLALALGRLLTLGERLVPDTSSCLNINGLVAQGPLSKARRSQGAIHTQAAVSLVPTSAWALVHLLA